MSDGRFRHGVDQRTGAVAAIVRRTGLTADHLTVLGLGLGVAAAVTFGSGQLLLGLVLCSGSLLVLMALTAAQRFTKVWRQAAASAEPSGSCWRERRDDRPTRPRRTGP